MNEPNDSGPPADGTPDRGLGRKLAVAVLIVCVAVGLALLEIARHRDPGPPPPAGAGPDRPPAEPSPSQKFEQVEVGMTVEEAERVMGPGDRTANKDGTERLRWTQNLTGGRWVLYVTVKDGKVMGKGNELR
jgi:hypothetical protein